MYLKRKTKAKVVVKVCLCVCVCELNKNHLKIQVSASLTKFLSFFNGHPGFLKKKFKAAWGKGRNCRGKEERASSTLSLANVITLTK